MDPGSYQWNFVDLAVLALLLIGLIGGFVKGFTWQIVRLAFLVLAFFLSGRYAERLGAWMGEVTGQRIQESVQTGVAYALVFAGVYLGSWPLAYLLRSGIEKLRLQSFDRVLGGLLGSVKAAAVSYVLVLCVIYFAPRLAQDSAFEKEVLRSIAYELVSEMNPTLSGLLPEEFHERVEKLRERVEEEIDERRRPAEPSGAPETGEHDPQRPPGF